MTSNMRLPPILTAFPAELGEAMMKGLDRRNDVIYVRSIWFFLMLIIRLMLGQFFKQLRL
ncbi:hypothetical protein [Bradyrhizobium sp. BR 1433]|uniref:hypothetical protein n=1 Tax=Bradyrhizobium sp. BR 1433 TaxID=3447967 RepID=UPI003EE5BC33